MIPKIVQEKCSGCGDCVDACPPMAIELLNNKAWIKEELCEECGVCADECQEDAITIPPPA